MTDNNVVISSLLSHAGLPALVFELVLQNHLPVCTLGILNELGSVLSRAKFKKLGTLLERLEFVQRYALACVLLNVTSEITDCRDPKDNQFLSLALEARADLLISGDEDLLILHPWRDIPILTSKQALAYLS